MLGKGKRQIYIKHKMSSCFKNTPFKKVTPQHNLWTITPTTPCLHSLFLKTLCICIKYIYMLSKFSSTVLSHEFWLFLELQNLVHMSLQVIKVLPIYRQCLTPCTLGTYNEIKGRTLNVPYTCINWLFRLF